MALLALVLFSGCQIIISYDVSLLCLFCCVSVLSFPASSWPWTWVCLFVYVLISFLGGLVASAVLFLLLLFFVVIVTFVGFLKF